MKMLPYSTQDVRDDDIRAVVKALKSPYLTQGPVVAEFESSLAKYTGARYAVVFSSGTAALHAAYAAAGLGKGDEVIMPALTFAATANAALYLGARPVFSDGELTTGNIDSKCVEQLLTKKTKALVAVDYAGRPADLDACRKLAKKRGLVFIEDGAQSLGARYKGKSVGTQADMTMFSFHPVKSITTGEGGVIVTNNKTYYEYLLMFRTHGMTKDLKKFEEKKYAAWHQEMHILGNNYRMTDIQAALGTSQMKRLPAFIRERGVRAARYYELLAHVPGLILPPHDTKETLSAWHLFPVRLVPELKKYRDEIFTQLRKEGIGVQVHYLPVYLHPYYAKLGYKKGLCPNVEHYTSSVFSIPLFPSLTIKEQRFVAETLKRLLNRYTQ